MTRIIDTYEYKMSLAYAKELITEYTLDEFGSLPDFSDLEHIGVAYTTFGEEHIEVQAQVDLINNELRKYVDGTCVETHHYHLLDTFIARELECLDFNELTSVRDVSLTEKQREQMYEQGFDSDSKSCFFKKRGG